MKPSEIYRRAREGAKAHARADDVDGFETVMRYMDTAFAEEAKAAEGEVPNVPEVVTNAVGALQEMATAEGVVVSFSFEVLPKLTDNQPRHQCRCAYRRSTPSGAIEGSGIARSKRIAKQMAATSVMRSLARIAKARKAAHDA